MKLIPFILITTFLGVIFSYASFHIHNVFIPLAIACYALTFFAFGKVLYQWNRNRFYKAVKAQTLSRKLAK